MLDESLSIIREWELAHFEAAKRMQASLTASNSAVFDSAIPIDFENRILVAPELSLNKPPMPASLRQSHQH